MLKLLSNLLLGVVIIHNSGLYGSNLIIIATPQQRAIETSEQKIIREQVQKIMALRALKQDVKPKKQKRLNKK